MLQNMLTHVQEMLHLKLRTYGIKFLGKKNQGNKNGCIEHTEKEINSMILERKERELTVKVQGKYEVIFHQVILYMHFCIITP